jgi:polygalacturonase
MIRFRRIGIATPCCKTLALFAIACCAFACSAAAARAARVCNVQSYGAKADGTTMDTLAIQHAIDACAAKGGGTVRLSGGTFLTGPIVLKSHITLDVDKGATLLGTQNFAAYKPAIELRQPAVEPLIGAKHAVDITIRGGGTIDGAGQPWWKAVYSHDRSKFAANHRPRLILLDHCKHVLIENDTIENSPSWQLVPYYCDDVTIRNSRILAPARSPNTDGIDPFSSHHVTITHMLIDDGDDDVAIKSGQPGSSDNSPSTYIRITDSTFLHGHGMSIGSEVAGGVQHVYVSNVKFDGTENGIRIKSNRDRGGNIGDFVYRNLTMKNVQTPILITEYYPKIPKHAVAKPITRLTPHFHNITIDNVTATGARSAGIIIGLPESPVRGLKISNVHIHAQRALTISFAKVHAHNFTVTTTSGKPFRLLQDAKIIKH